MPDLDQNGRKAVQAFPDAPVCLHIGEPSPAGTIPRVDSLPNPTDAEGVLVHRIPAAVLEERTFACLREAGADEPSARAATRALMHASRLGVDSHGVRLVGHYIRALRGGRVNGQPDIVIRRTGPAVAVADADNGLGHLAAYRAMEEACALARENGVGAVGVRRSSHYGAAGAYAVAAAEAGFVGLSTTNADAVVALYQGRVPFHGTNPIAAAAPVKGGKPWLLDMATSAVPMNRVHLYATLGRPLPEDVAADLDGNPTTVANAARMLMPLGGEGFGFKGAGLAGLVTVLSAILTGAVPDPDMMPMTGTDDYATPRNVGHFCLVIDPDRFVGRATYEVVMAQYLAALRASPSQPGVQALAPGDREWRTEADRLVEGIPVDRDTAAVLGLA
jgi:ureidoglycolate dehydrogenase (NAD+)